MFRHDELSKVLSGKNIYKGFFYEFKTVRPEIENPQDMKIKPAQEIGEQLVLKVKYDTSTKAKKKR